MSDKTESQEGIRLGKFRKGKKISQREMASILGCFQPNLSKLEKRGINLNSGFRIKLFERSDDLNSNWLLMGRGKCFKVRPT
jgi:transcriptional regulator with XRE-family HTH domain